MSKMVLAMFTGQRNHVFQMFSESIKREAHLKMSLSAKFTEAALPK
jgi:hypothetical protein